MTVTVRMTSDDYGAEDFVYGSVDEALEGMKRLAKSASRESAGDRVEREIIMLCPFDGTEDEGSCASDNVS